MYIAHTPSQQCQFGNWLLINQKAGLVIAGSQEGWDGLPAQPRDSPAALGPVISLLCVLLCPPAEQELDSLSSVYLDPEPLGAQ